MEMLEICLWGNATDLSLLTSLKYEDIQKLQGSKARKAAEKNILVNDIPVAFQVLKAAQKTKGKQARQVDIVLDNAGFELFVDLILAGYLLSAGLATQIVLHPKSIPWFVSDVLPGDFGALLSALANPQDFFSSPIDEGSQSGTKPAPLSEAEISDLSFLFQHWSGFHQEGQLTIRPNRFWTHAGSYWRLPHTAPRLLDDFKQSELVIFKGDLNYRKLTGDVCLPLPLLHTRERVLTPNRPCGTLPRPLRPPSGPWDLDPGSASWLYGRAKQMSSSGFLRAKTISLRPRKEGAGIAGRANGLGAGSGLLFSFRTARSDDDSACARRPSRTFIEIDDYAIACSAFYLWFSLSSRVFVSERLWKTISVDSNLKKKAMLQVVEHKDAGYD